MDFTTLKLVPITSIPKGEDCPDDPITLWKLGLFMEEICERESGIGLSAVQVGVPWNFFIVKFQEGYRHFANCTYQSRGDTKITGAEGCLSIRADDNRLRYFEVQRFKEITIKGKEIITEPTPHLAEIELFPDKMFAPIYNIVFQHEIDHSYQITIDMIGKEIFLWTNKTT